MHRLALVTETYPPEINGVAMTLGRLVDGLRSLDWEVLVIRPKQAGERVIADKRELVLPSMPLPGYDGLRMGLPCVLRLLREWRRERPDIVHIATEGPLGLAALYAAREYGLPVSSTFHTNFHQYSEHYRFGFFRDLAQVFLRIVHNASDCSLAPTRQMADELDLMGFRNTGVLSRGVDTEMFDPALRDEALRAEWGASEGDRVALYVGRVAREKNVDLAIKAFRRAKAAFPRLRMVVVGDGPELERLRVEYPEVVYAGMRRGADLARHYASGDLFFFPSVTETFGNVVTEGLSSGLAVVTFDYAAGREYISDTVDGFLAEFGDAAAYQAAAVRAASLPELELAAVRAAARKRAMGVAWSSIARQFAAALMMACQLRKRRMVCV